MKNIGKTELTKSIAEKSNITHFLAKLIFNIFLQLIEDELKRHNKIKIVGFGTFSLQQKSEVQRRNPKTGEPILVPAHSVPKFTPSKAFKQKFR